MSAINADTQAAWQAIADSVSGQRPYTGRRVRVDGGRKHKGKEGTVLRHQQSQYEAFYYRYSSEASAHMLDMRGREGWACLVDFGTERAWVPARHLTVLT